MMSSRTRIVALVLAGALVALVTGCSKPSNPSRPAEEGPPMQSTQTTGAATPTTGASEPSQPTTTLPLGGADSRAALRRAAMGAAVAAAVKASSPDVGRLSATDVKLAQANDGTWWASVVVTSSREGFDPLPVYLHWTPHGFVVVDLGTGIDPATGDRIPPEVGDEL